MEVSCKFNTCNQVLKSEKIPTVVVNSPMLFFCVCGVCVFLRIIDGSGLNHTQYCFVRGCQSGTWSQRGTKVNGHTHGENPPLRSKSRQNPCQVYPPENIENVYVKTMSVFRYDLQLLLSQVLPDLPKPSKVSQKRFPCYRRIRRYFEHDMTINITTSYQ